MDAAFALLLPLVGGFLFIKECVFVKYVAAREDGHRIYFRVAYYGVYLFATSLCILGGIYWLLSEQEWFNSTLDFFSKILEPLMKEKSSPRSQLGFLAVCFFTVPIGRLSPFFINKFMKKFMKGSAERALWAAAGQNELEGLLLEALFNTKTISVTLSSNKVYVGLVLSTPEPRTERRGIALQPLMSGYRTEQGKVTFTTFYDAQIKASPQAADEGEFRLVLPVDKILSVSFFDVETYAKFNAKELETAPS